MIFNNTELTALAYDTDWVIVNKDLKVVHNYDTIILQNVINRLKSDYGDYALNKSFGFNSDFFIGLPVDNTTALRLEDSMKLCLTFDGFLSKEDFRILWYLQDNSIIYRLILNDNNYTTFTYDRNTGLKF